ncbi:MAG: glycoside hydrolase family 32 protein [Bryobacteraceae bacterium]
MLRKLAKLVALPVATILCLFAQERYGEPYRPQFHFSPQMNWTNDPCGLVFAFGKYHLFFQYNPFANVWGHMSWGHATSPDLVHWTQHPVAIPEDSKAAIFTGSSVIDTKNTSGLCISRQGGCIVSIYTGFSAKTATTPERQTENLAYSQDGLTWTKYSGNPILDLGRSDTRDPKVFWFAPTKRWIMVIVQANDKKLRIFGSRDLKQWQPLSEFGPQGATGGVWECPDLYRLPVEGQPDKTRWILKVGLNPGHIAGGSGEQYFIGQFDGTRFTNENASNEIHWLDYGRDCYCALTFNNEPADRPRHIIGWMNNWEYAAGAPTSPWRGAMTLPRSLSLAEVDGSLRLLQQPVEDLQSLRGDALEYNGGNEAELNRRVDAWPHLSQTFELQTEIKAGTAKEIVWKLLEGKDDETLVGFNVAKGELFVDRSMCANAHFNESFPSKTVAPLKLDDRPLRLRIFVDRSSIEVFAQDGKIVMTNLVFPKPDSTGISLSASGGRLENVQLKIRSLHSAWKERPE